MQRAAMRRQHDRFGGPEGNEMLTSATAVVLIGLLMAEGLTIVHMGGLVSAHMFIGMVLIPPVLLKLASTGYRFVRYYTRSRAYRAKGPPPLPLRLLAPVLVATTLAVFVTGVLLLLAGHKSDTLLLVHKVSFIVWGVVFAVHFLAYVPRVVRAVLSDWGAARRKAVPGAGTRVLLLAAALGGGRARALATPCDGRLARLRPFCTSESSPVPSPFARLSTACHVEFRGARLDQGRIPKCQVEVIRDGHSEAVAGRQAQRPKGPGRGKAEAHDRSPAGQHPTGFQEQARRGRQRGGKAGHALEDRNREQIYEIAKKKGISGRSSMGKRELIDATRKAG